MSLIWGEGLDLSVYAERLGLPWKSAWREVEKINQGRIIRDTEEGDGELSRVVLEASRAQPHTPGSDISSFPLELGPGFFTPKSQHLQGISDSGPEILPENLECIPGMHLAL